MVACSDAGLVVACTDAVVACSDAVVACSDAVVACSDAVVPAVGSSAAEAVEMSVSSCSFSFSDDAPGDERAVPSDSRCCWFAPLRVCLF